MLFSFFSVGLVSIKFIDAFLSLGVLSSKLSSTSFLPECGTSGLLILSPKENGDERLV